MLGLHPPDGDTPPEALPTHFAFIRSSILSTTSISPVDRAHLFHTFDYPFDILFEPPRHSEISSEFIPFGRVCHPSTSHHMPSELLRSPAKSLRRVRHCSRSISISLSSISVILFPCSVTYHQSSVPFILFLGLLSYDSVGFQ